MHAYFNIFVWRVLTHSLLNFQEFALKIKCDAGLLENTPIDHTPIPHVIQPVHNKLTLFPDDLKIDPQTLILFDRRQVSIVLEHFQIL